MTILDYKLQVFKEILPLENEYALKQVYKLVHSFLIEYRKNLEKSNKSKELGFDEWNKQFEGHQDLDSFLPEYGTSLQEFRKLIYEAEVGEEITMEEFKKSLGTW
ncbi:MAG: hypothetical protein DRJ05_08850 [Bacteroidetes bacterium]|nr:MAG: hypothetical protein DRJ05_08850 [Bacteroidota bacterium]